MASSAAHLPDFHGGGGQDEIAAEHKCPWTGGSDRHNYTATEGHASEAPEECLRLLKEFVRQRQ